MSYRDEPGKSCRFIPGGCPTLIRKMKRSFLDYVFIISSCESHVVILDNYIDHKKY